MNYSVVQSVAGSFVSDYFTKEWGGKVRVGSLGCNPMNHLVLRDVQLITPEGDTVCNAHKMAFRFNGFPYSDNSLSFQRVLLKDVYYHLNIDTAGLNLDFIIKYFATEDDEEEDDDEEVEFKVLVDDLVLDNVCYRQDLKDLRSAEERANTVGVDVKHMEYRNIKGYFRNVRVNLDRVTCRIDHLSTEEKGGLVVKDMQMNVYATRSGISATNMCVETSESKLMGDVLLDYRDWESMDEFLDSVFFTVRLDKGSYGGMHDAALWAHELWGMDDRVYIEGCFSGPISDFRADSVSLAFGSESSVELDAYIYGLPNIDTTVIGADIHRLHTTYADLAAVHHPASVKLQGEKILKTLNNIDMQASFAGTIYDFYATVEMESDPGNLKGDVVLSMNPQKKRYHYTGEMQSDDFKLWKMAPNKWISRGGFDITFEGDGFDPHTMNASAEGQLHHLVVKGQRILGEVALDADATDGLITVDATLDDELLDLMAHCEGDWRGDFPRYRANVDASHLNLKRFGLWNDTMDHSALVSFKAEARHSAMNEDNSTTRIALRDVSLSTTTKDVKLKSLVLSSREQNHWMNTTLRSDVADAQLRGYYRYEGLPVMLKKLLRDFMPTFDNKYDEVAADYLAESRFEFNMEWKDTAQQLRYFVPKLGVATGTTIQANYNYADGFKPIIRSDSLSWGDVHFYDVGVNGESMSDHYVLQMKSDRMLLGQLQLMDFGNIKVESSHDGMNCRALWYNSSQKVGGGDVNLRFVADSDMMRLVVDPSRLALGGKEWNLSAKGDNNISSKGIHVEGLNLVSGDESVNFKAIRMGDVNDSVVLVLKNLGLEIANPFFAASGVDFSGRASGVIRMDFLTRETETHADTKETETAYLNGKLQVDSLAFNGEQLGDALVSSSWDADKNRLNVSMLSSLSRIETMSLNGYMTLGESDPQLVFDAKLEDVGMKVIEPFVRSFSSRVDGKMSADMALRGTMSRPVVAGYVAVKDGLMNVDFLNVAYSFSDTISLDSANVHLDNFMLRDPDSNIAIIDGRITHNNLKDVKLDLNVVSSRLLCMNTSARQNNEFYGHIVAGVDGMVKGPVDNLAIILNARTMPGTSLTVPINDRRQMEQADYIHFVSDDLDFHYGGDSETASSDDMTGTVADNNRVSRTSDNSSKYSLTINVEVTPDMQFRMPMDFSSITADVKAEGNGNLQLLLGTGRQFGLVGDYEMSDGTLLLDLLGVISKEFTIDEGSSITLPGSIDRAMFDIRAVLSQRVNLSTLTGSLSSTDSQKPVQVENVIALSGTLQSPKVSFDLRLPNADQSVQEEVFSYIDRNNERDMLNQTVSLLVSKRFYNASASVSQDQGTTGNQAYGLVMGTLGGMISEMVQVVDVNFDYQAGNGLTTDQYAVDISKEWNKLYFESTFGFGGESREFSTSAGNNNNMTGDMLVGYKLNPRLHLFVFNRSNTNDYTRSYLPYKQGLGLKYTRDFDKLGDLFVNNRKKKQAKK